MGIVQKEALRTTIISYFGLILGYVNKVALFVFFLSPEQVGLTNLILAVGSLFAQLSNLGVVNTTWKFFPILKNQEKNNYGFLTLNFLIVFAGITLTSLAVFLFKDVIADLYSSKSESFVHYFYWIIPCGIGIVLYRFLDSYLRALYKNVFSVIANEFILRLVTTILLGLFALGYLNFGELLAAICISQFIPALLLIFYLYRINEWHFSIKEINIPKRFKKIIVSYSLFSYVNSLGGLMVVTIDAMMLASFMGLEETAVYTTVIYLIRALLIPYASIMRVSAPLVAEHWKTRDMKEMGALYKKVSSVNLVIGMFFFLGIWINRTELFGFLPEEYLSGIYVFMILMIGRLLDMYFGLNGTIMVTSKKYKYDILFTFALFIIVIILNLYMIPLWGLYGAAISTTIAFFIYNFTRLIFVWYHYKIHPFEKSQFLVMVLFTVALLGFECASIDTMNVWVNMVIKSLLAVVAFPAVIYAFKIEKETVNYINKVLEVVKKKIFN